MVQCPKCGQEVAGSAYFCNFCGATLQNASSDDLEQFIRKRLDAIRTRDEGILDEIFDPNTYTKFDDWPPFTRQDAPQALRNERDAYKVLSGYSYELTDLRKDLANGTAIATCHINYAGTIRGRGFDVHSRVTMILARRNQTWKVVHEHWSRFPEERVRRGLFR